MSPLAPVQIVSAPSTLGLWPSGVEQLADTLLANNLAQRLNHSIPVIVIPNLNDEYSPERDIETACLNPMPIRKFSSSLCSSIEQLLLQRKFPLVLGGDCSILIGIMMAVKKIMQGGLCFIDAHADFYSSHQSTTGQVADMDLAIVTGRGPDLLTDIDGLKPYVPDSSVLHLAQRDQQETIEYGSQQISGTGITCIDYKSIQANGAAYTKTGIKAFLDQRQQSSFWIHFDTDSLNDSINPAVDYRLPGGLSWEQAKSVLETLLASGQMIGMSVTIFNPAKDPSGAIAENLVQLLTDVLKSH